MINLEEIKCEIERLKKEETTYKNCERLAILTTVLEYMQSERSDNAYSFSPNKNTPEFENAPRSNSEFISAIQKAGLNKSLQVLDEHMQLIKLVYPKEYSLIIDKLML